MSCLTLSSGICRGCRDNAGGVKNIYLANIKDVDWTGLTNAQVFPATTPATFTTAIDDLPLTSPGVWYKLEPNKNTSNWVETINASVENGTIYYEQVVTAVFGRNSTAMRDTIVELGQSELICVVENTNGSWFILGQEDNGVNISGGSFASGTAYADLNGWTINLTVNSTVPAYEVNTQAGVTGDTMSGNTLYTTLKAVTC